MTILACTSIVITAVYILRVVGKLLYGKVVDEHHLQLTDAVWYERFSAIVCLLYTSVYDKVDFKEITYNHGDTFNRYMVRMDEIVESLHILEQLVDNIPEGDFAVKTKPIIKLPEGQYYKSVEAARGEFGVYICLLYTSKRNRDDDTGRYTRLRR